MSESHRPEHGTRADLLERRTAERPGLRAGILGLAQLDLGGSGTVGLLTRIAGLAVAAVPRADGAGLTVPGGAEVATAEFVHEVEEVAHRIHEGPSLTAITEGCAVCSGSLGGEPRWPHFGPRAGRLGVHSVLSVPLVHDGAALGAIDVYAHDKDAFDDAAVESAQLFAAVAAVSVANANVFADAQRRAAQLEHAVSSRAVIERAVGILISRTGVSADEAFERLRGMSQAQHRKVVALADALVQASAGRARARRTREEGSRHAAPDQLPVSP